MCCRIVTCCFRSIQEYGYNLAGRRVQGFTSGASHGGTNNTSAALLFACCACSGEAVVTQAGKEVNRLFKSDFFGERALLVNEPRGATVAASQATVCLVLDRETFTEVLGPLDSAMTVRWAVHGGAGWHVVPYAVLLAVHALLHIASFGTVLAVSMHESAYCRRCCDCAPSGSATGTFASS
jgi:hypothetical protein